MSNAPRSRRPGPGSRGAQAAAGRAAGRATAGPAQSRAMTGRAVVPGPGRGRAAPDRLRGRAVVPAPPSVPPTNDGGEHRGGRASPPPAPPARVAGGGGRRWRRRLLVGLLAVLLVVAVGIGGLWLYADSLSDNMTRTEAFAPITAERPEKVTPGSLNILLLGSDSRDPDAVGDVYRADTIMLMHVPASEDHVYLISIPRDLWVYVPPNADGTAGDRQAKVNAATAFGGVPLAVQAIEGYTDVRIDHVVLVDFGGFVEVTDALGGVELDIPQTIRSIHGEHRVFEEGRQQLNGEEALDYIRQRYQFADGDFARMRNQQQFLKALMDKAASTGTLTNPTKLNAFLQTLTQTLTVDEEFSLVGVGWSVRHLRSDNLTFLTSPHLGSGTAGGESVVLSDDEAAAELYAAIREDRMATWVSANPDRLND